MQTEPEPEEQKNTLYVKNLNDKVKKNGMACSYT